MAEHHAISRRAFTLGLGLAALSPLASLPETAAPGIPLRAAFADDTPKPAEHLGNFVIRLRPAGYFRTASVNQTEPISSETARSRKKPRKKTLSTWQ